jgi:LmbE family N-acetylglucosaminyl deacetylase
MRVLYVFPHPDDESFGPAPVMARQRREGHGVHLLTLTRGGATRQRHRYGHSVEEMGEVRREELQAVARLLDLNGIRILDFPDGGLKEVDPRELEDAVGAEIDRVRPHVLVTYAVHGVSGFLDHLVSHAVVKRAFVARRAARPELQRLALLTLTEEVAERGPLFRLSGSPAADIDCQIPPAPEDLAKGQRALDCYVTFQETIERSGIRRLLEEPACFEFFQEDWTPPLTDLFAGLGADPEAGHAGQRPGGGIKA